MGRTQSDHLRFPRPNVAWQPDLPAGIRQADCDGPENELADSDGNRLWNACDVFRQESVSARFVQLNLEQFRDALLDTQDAFALAAASSNETPGASLAAGSGQCGSATAIASWGKWSGGEIFPQSEFTASRGGYDDVGISCK